MLAKGKIIGWKFRIAQSVVMGLFSVDTD